MKKWLNRLLSEGAFCQSEEAVQTLEMMSVPAGTIGKMEIPKVLMNLYLKNNAGNRKAIRKLLLIAGKKGFSFAGKCHTGFPVFFHILQFRLFDLYPFIAFPSGSVLSLYVNLSGYMGVLVKASTALVEAGKDEESIVEQRNTPFAINGVLQYLKGKKHSSAGVLFHDLISAVEGQPLPKIRPVDVNAFYKVSSHKNLPQIHKFAVHDAVLHYHHQLFKRLVSAGANLTVQDFWGRNVLHLAEIVGAEEIAQTIQGMKPKLVATLQAQRDGLGRRPLDIRHRKSQKTFVSPAPLAENNGGWSEDILPGHLEDERCDIDVVHHRDINFQRFSKDFLSLLKPVVIRGGSRNLQRLRKLWEKKTFLARFGSLPIETGEIPYADSFGLRSNRCTIGQFSQQADDYAFCGITPKSHGPMFQDFVHCGFFTKLQNTHFQYYQGKPGTGAPVHFHVDAWNALVHGRKRWFIFPPMKGMYTTKPIGQWLTNHRNQVKPLVFTQYAGDIVYIPRFWAHGVLNIKESVGIAAEFAHPYVT